MKRNGIISILIGVGCFIVSILFSSGARPKLGVLANLPRMEIVIKEGTYIPSTEVDVAGHKFYLAGHYDGRVTIPLKIPLSLSVVIILIGSGMIILSKRES